VIAKALVSAVCWLIRLTAHVFSPGAEPHAASCGRWLVGSESSIGQHRRDLRCSKDTAGGANTTFTVPAADLSAAMLASAPWQKGARWRREPRRPADLRDCGPTVVRIADGHRHRMTDNRRQAKPGEEVWLVWRETIAGEEKYYVSNLPPETSLKALAATIKARWICEQAHQQLKEELGLDHFESRSWKGLHRHARMTMIAYAYLQPRRLQASGRKKRGGPPPKPRIPAVRQAAVDLFARSTRCAYRIVRSFSQRSSKRKCQISAKIAWPLTQVRVSGRPQADGGGWLDLYLTTCADPCLITYLWWIGVFLCSG
jgi:hypothetical protein